MLKHDYPYTMNEWKKLGRFHCRTGSNTWKLLTTTNFNIPGWVQSDASREKHRTPAGSLFCRPASTAQSVLALLVRRGFVDYLHRHCQIYRRSSATRWCLKDKRATLIISYYLSFYHIWADDTRAVLIDDPTVPVYQYPMVINDTVST